MPIISSTQSVQMKNYFLFLFAITIMIATTTQAQIISTVAGNGTGGYNGDGGTAINTSLYYPMGVAVDAVGNIFIVDQSNHRVRKVNTSGIISTVAGNGTGGYSGDGGAAINASLNYPMGVAVDAVGNIYIADQANYRIRKVGANGNISTVAGNGISGYSGDGGAATSASLNVPEGVAVDAVGNIFIADAGSHIIRKVNASGVISTVAGNGTEGFGGDGGAATSANLYQPFGVAVDADGNIFIADSKNNRIRKVNNSGVISTIAGNGTHGFSVDGGAATNASLYAPSGVAVDAFGNIYIADVGNHRIRKTTNNIPTTGLVAWYPFTGNTLDSSGNNNHGTNTGAILTTDRFGKVNSAYLFNGASGLSRITVPDSKSLTVGSALTISLWVKYNSLANNDNILLEKGTYGNGISDGYNLYFDNNFGKLPYYEKGLLYGNGSSSYGIGDTSNLDNGWHHMLVVYNPSIGNRIYIDGKLKRQYQPSLCTSCKILNSTNSLYIGNTGFGVPWNGSIDDIRIYNTSIDSVGVQALYHEGGYATNSTIPSNGLVAWYPFTGNTLDSSGNNNHGTNNGATLTTDRFGKANSAYLFNGLSDYIYVRDTAFLRTPHITISCWINTPKISEQFILSKTQFNTSKGEQYLFWMNDTLLGFEIKRNSGCTPGLNWQKNRIQSSYLSTNKWFYNCLTYDGYTMKYYINGNLISSFNPPNGPIDSCSEGTLNLGRYWMNNKSYYNGKLDDIRIYNRALDSVEIQYLYHEGGYNGSPLPVTFEDIYGLKLDNTIEINWQTSNELNNSNFVIQHSTDGTSFTDIGTVKAIGSGANWYSFTDNNPTTYPLNGVLYYRLKSVDKDGTSSYSKVISVQLTIDNFQLSITPNPAKSIVTVKGNHIASIQVIDNLGKVLKTQIVKDATNPTLSVSSLPVGIYHLRVQTTDGKVSGVGFVKE